jgi:hypothetical protein
MLIGLNQIVSIKEEGLLHSYLHSSYQQTL